MVMMKEVRPVRAVRDAEFREFVKAVQELAIRAYPNPERVGCPGDSILREVAGQSRPSAHPVFRSHIVTCSPCIAELLAERTRLQAHQKARRRMIVALAAGVCLLAVLFGWRLRYRTPSEINGQLASAKQIPEIPIDLRPYSPMRSDTAHASRSPIAAPLQHVKLKLYLSPGAPLGPYEIRVLTGDLRTMRTAQAAAVLKDGVTSILVTLDLADLRPGAYVLVLRPARPDEDWQTYPLVLRRPA